MWALGLFAELCQAKVEWNRSFSADVTRYDNNVELFAPALISYGCVVIRRHCFHLLN